MLKRNAAAEVADGTKRSRRAAPRGIGADPYAAHGPSMKTYQMREAPTFRPTLEEWADPAAYVAGIRHAFEGFGICKIVPPAGWAPPSDLAERRRSAVLYPTRVQAVHEVSLGRAFPDGREYTFAQYERMALAHKRSLFPAFLTEADPPVPAPRPISSLCTPAVVDLTLPSEREGASVPVPDSAAVSREGANPHSIGTESAPPALHMAGSQAAGTAPLPQPASRQDSLASTRTSESESLPSEPSLASASVDAETAARARPPHPTPPRGAAVAPDAAPSPGARMAPAVEAWYWARVEAGGPPLFVEYANDQDTRRVGSGFPSRFKPPSAGGESPAAVAAAAAASGAALASGAAAAGEREHAGDSAGAVSRAQAARLSEEFDPSACFPSCVPARFSEPTYYRDCGWNLNNLPFIEASVLRHVNEEINGVNVPWLYCGMLFATFAWHAEDHYLYSINYLHHGAGKTWYGVPGQSATEMERALGRHIERTGGDADALHGITYVISPAQAGAEGVPVFRLFQEAGEFVVTLPRAFHTGFSHGFNMGEACNFALPDWLGLGRRAVEHYRSTRNNRNMCFSHDQLLCNLAKRCRDHPPEACLSICGELEHVIRTEARERAALVADDGVSTQIHLTNEGDPRYECVHCHHICYLSAVICRCSAARRRVACLRHARLLCACPPAQRILVFWYDLAALRGLQDAVTQWALLQGGRAGGPGAAAGGKV